MVIKMNGLIDGFLAWPLWGRTAAVLGILIFVFWLILGKPVIIRILSVIPFLLRKLFHGFYIAIEWVASFFHKKIGSGFFDLENGMSRWGERMDFRLERWYRAWHQPQKRHVFLAIVVYLLLFLLVGVLPMAAASPDSPLKAGERAYLRCEDAFVNFLEEHGLYVSEEKVFQESLFLQIHNKNLLQNGVLLETDTSPRTVREKTYIPIRNVITLLGGTVEWESQTQSILLKIDGKELELHPATGTVYFEDREISLADRPVEIEDKIYVGVREILETLGYHVFWYGGNEIVMISKTMDFQAPDSVIEKVNLKLNP